MAATVFPAMRARRAAGRLATLCCAGAVAVAAGGCAGTGTIDPVAQAASTSTSVPGFKMALTEQIGSPNISQPLTATGSGYFDQRRRSGLLKFGFDLSRLPGAGALGGQPLSFTMLIQGLVLYLKVPQTIAGQVAGGRPWLRVDLAQATKGLGIDLSSLSDPSTTNPAQFLQYLRAASGGVTTVGTDTIRGVATTHYRATIDLSRYPSLVPAAQRGQAQAAISGLERVSGVTKLPIDVWVDGQHLVRRERFSMNENSPSAGRVSVLVNTDLFDYGPQPVVTAPPSSQVFDAGALISAAESHAARGVTGPAGTTGG